MMEKMEKFYFNGIWRKEGAEDIYIFTDELTKGTFTVVGDETFIRKITDLRARFGQGFPDDPQLIYPR